MTRVLRTFRLDEDLSGKLDLHNKRHGDLTVMVEAGLNLYFDSISEPEPKPVKPTKAKKKPVAKILFTPDQWLDWGFPCRPSDDVFNAWMDMRKTKGHTISNNSFKGIGKGLTDASKAGYTIDQCLTQAETNSWKGFRGVWMSNSTVDAFGGRGQNAGGGEDQQDFLNSLGQGGVISEQ